MLRAHKNVVSIPERAVQNSSEEIEPDFRLVISANMSDMAVPRRYNATVAHQKESHINNA